MLQFQAFRRNHSHTAFKGLVFGLVVIGLSSCSNQAPNEGIVGTTVQDQMIATASLLGPNDRIAISTDGNHHDHDDIAATAAYYALLAAECNQERLVHFDHSSHLGANTADQYNEMKKSANEGARRFGIDPNVVFDDQTQLNQAINSIKNAVNASSANSHLYFCIGGPFEVAWRGINASDPAKRRYVTVISHSLWNDSHTDTRELNHDGGDIRALGVNYKKIKGQNCCGFNLIKHCSGSACGFDILDRILDDENIPNLAWFVERCYAAGRADYSDAGMVWYVLTGSDESTPEQFGNYLNNGPCIDGSTGGGGGGSTDSDGDGVSDGIDNCPNTYNANQADRDNDGMGNACDDCPDDPDNDVDGDGVCGDVDNCPATSNSNQADTDGDGIGDACDSSDPVDPPDGSGDIVDWENWTDRQNAASATQVSGYLGSEYSKIKLYSNSYYEITYEAPAAGTYSIEFHYLGIGTSLGCPFKVNGSSVSTLDLTSGAVDQWQTTTLDVSLESGINTLRLESNGSEHYYVDYMVISSGSGGGDVPTDPVDSDGDGIPDSDDACPNDPTNTCGGTPGDQITVDWENWTDRQNAATETDVSGYLGNEYNKIKLYSNSYYEITFDAPAAGTYSVEFHYLGIGTSLGCPLKVNGTTVSTLDLTSGSVDQWQTTTVDVSLESGINTFRLESNGSEHYYVDYMVISSGSTSGGGGTTDPVDSDGDGIPDSDDACPSDPTNTCGTSSPGEKIEAESLNLLGSILYSDDQASGEASVKLGSGSATVEMGSAPNAGSSIAIGYRGDDPSCGIEIFVNGSPVTQVSHGKETYAEVTASVNFSAGDNLSFKRTARTATYLDYIVLQ